MKTKILLSITMLMLIIISCTQEKTKVITSKEDGKKYMVTIECDSAITDDFGNGVYYYAIQGSKSPWSIHNEFGPVISNFIASHKELKISALSPNLNDGDGNDVVGYWIITEPKLPCPCDSVKQLKK